MKNNKKNKQIQRCLVFDDLNSTYQIKFKRLKKKAYKLSITTQIMNIIQKSQKKLKDYKFNY